MGKDLTVAAILASQWGSFSWGWCSIQCETVPTVAARTVYLMTASTHGSTANAIAMACMPFHYGVLRSLREFAFSLRSSTGAQD